MSHRLGIDVGGTFTDVLIQDADGRVQLVKTPSTPADQSEGVARGVALVCEQAGIAPRDITALLHGTTAATNAVLEGRGARVGVVVTTGFRHLFHLAEAWTPGPLFGFMVYDRPPPLVEVRLVAEVPGAWTRPGPRSSRWTSRRRGAPSSTWWPRAPRRSRSAC
nr:hydantoinase/oxoprolinase N-terminal domain-containing protein [Baekduia soli]